MDSFLYFCPDNGSVENFANFLDDKIENRSLLYLYDSELAKLYSEDSAKYLGRKLYALNESIGLVEYDIWANVCGPYPKANRGSDPTAKPMILFTFLILIFNFIICFILTRKHMRTPTHLILLSITIAEFFAALTIFPIQLVKESVSGRIWWSFLNKQPEITYARVNFSNPKATHEQVCDSPILAMSIWMLEYFFPSLTHSAVIWLNIALAAQRYIYVSFPTKISHLCTIKSSLYASLGALVVALTVQSPLMTFRFANFKPVVFVINPTESFKCHQNISSLLEALNTVPGQSAKCSNSYELMALYYSFIRTLAVHVIPSVLVIVFTVLLLIAMRNLSKRRKRLFVDRETIKQKKRLPPVPSRSSVNGDIDIVKIRRTKQECTVEARTGKFLWLCQFHRYNPCQRLLSSGRDRSSSNPQSTSRMLMVILFIFLTVECLSMGCELMYIYSRGRSNSIADIFKHYFEWMKQICNIILIVSYLMNFFIYWLMSVQFRATLLSIFSKNPTRFNEIARRMSKPDVATEVGKERDRNIKTASNAIKSCHFQFGLITAQTNIEQKSILS